MVIRSNAGKWQRVKTPKHSDGGKNCSCLNYKWIHRSLTPTQISVFLRCTEKRGWDGWEFEGEDLILWSGGQSWSRHCPELKKEGGNWREGADGGGGGRGLRDSQVIGVGGIRGLNWQRGAGEIHITDRWRQCPETLRAKRCRSTV